jgi:hypothetical protein
LPAAISILLLHGDAEARLLVDAEVAMQSMFVDREVRLVKQWATRPDCLESFSPAPAGSPQTFDVVPGTDVRELLEQRHSLIIFSLLPAITLPALRNKSGRVFLPHPGLRASWSADVTARVAAEYSEQSPLSPAEAAIALEPVIERLLANGSAVAVCTTFRHVKTPLEHRGSGGVAGLREVIRRTNLEVFRLSQRTGCFVLDFDRPLAQEGGASLNADCFGGDDRAAEIALDEFAALVLDAIPDSLISSEVS